MRYRLPIILLSSMSLAQPGRSQQQGVDNFALSDAELNAINPSLRIVPGDAAGPAKPAMQSVPDNPVAVEQAPTSASTDLAPTQQAIMDTEDVDTLPVAIDRAPLAPELPPPNEFAGAPSVPGSRKDLAYGEAPEEYVVEEGDTLYDICDQLIDEPEYWPKLWALNPAIRNPHFIYPKMRLAFYSGDANNPPYLNVVEEDDVVPVDKGGIVEAQMLPPKKDISHLLLEATKPLDTPIIADSEVAIPEDIARDFEVWGETYQNNQISVVIPAFVFADEPAEVGEVVAGVEGQTLTGYNTRVILDGEGMAAGSTYTVLRSSGSVRREDSDDFVGYRYEFVANVKVLQILPDGFAEATATFVRMGARSGDIVVPYLSTQRSIPSGDQLGNVSPADSIVIGFEQPGRVLGGRGDLILLSGKVTPGQYVPIYRDLRKNAPASAAAKMPTNNRVAGYVRVVDTVGEASVGYIVRNDYDLRVGDLTQQANL